MPDRRPSLIDRTSQNIPLPLGGMAPVRMHHSSAGHPLHAISRLAPWFAICSALAGVFLLLLPSTVPASLLRGHIVVGSMDLRETRGAQSGSTRLYGGDASFALTERGDGSAHAVAAWVTAGSLSSGACDLYRDGGRLLDYCTFAGPQGSITAVDRLDPALGSDWQRTYADGAHVTIAVPTGGAAIPVPFPIGRP